MPIPARPHEQLYDDRLIPRCIKLPRGEYDRLVNSASRGIFKFGIVLAVILVLPIFGWWRSAGGLILFFAGVPLVVFGGLAGSFMAVELKKHFEATLPLKMLLMFGVALLGVVMIFAGIGLITHDVALLWRRLSQH